LKGSVRKSDNKIRITVQLIKASDGSYVWIETFDRTMDDVFILLDDVANGANYATLLFKRE
jgi:adenylate cyclase